MFDSARRFPIVVSAALYLAVALVCTQIPLLNYLGYEFSALTALLSTFVAGFSTITSVKKQLANPDSGSPRAAFWGALVLNLILLAIPLAVMLTNGLFVKNCSVLEGLAFFILLPVVTVLFSAALGFFCAAHYRFAKIVFTLAVLITFAEVLAVGYFTPAIFSYNFFYGYFPGLTYDEILGISWSLVLFRVLTLLLAGMLVWMSLLLLDHTERGARAWEKGVALLGAMIQGRNVFITGAAATVIVVVWWFRGELGFDSSSAFIQRQLGAKFESRHVIIYYARQSYDEQEIKQIAEEHEFRIKQIADVLHVMPRERIASYIYSSAEMKRRLMGAGNTNIAKPWSGEIHITAPSLDGTLKHELVHVMAAPFGLPIIKASLSTGLVEGLAMAIEGNWGNRTLHQYAAAMRKFGVGTDITSMMTLTGFAAQASSVSYALAGSFCRYLIDEYGIRAMMLVYRSGDYERVFGKSLTTLVREWQAFLDGVPVADQERDVVDVLFRRPPIFGKVCARVVAARNAEARTLLGKRNYEGAYAHFRQSFDETRSYESLSGMIAAALRMGRYTEVTSLFDSVIINDDRPAQFLPLMLSVGDAFVMRGDSAKGAELFRRVEVGNISAGLTEAALLRLRASVYDTAAWRGWFLSDEQDSTRIASLRARFGNEPLAQYLLASSLLRLKRYAESAAALDSLRFPAAGTTLEPMRLRRLGFALFKAREYDHARAAFWRALNHTSSDAERSDLTEWVDRCEWMMSSPAR